MMKFICKQFQVFVLCLMTLSAVEAQDGGLELENQSNSSSDQGAKLPQCMMTTETDRVAVLLSCIISNYTSTGGIDDGLSASYALGVTFQREVAAKYKELDYLQLLLGLQDQANDTVKVSDSKLRSLLDGIILSNREQSDKFVREFSQKSGTKALRGIYYIDRSKEYKNYDQIPENNEDVPSDQPAENQEQNVIDNKDQDVSVQHTADLESLVPSNCDEVEDNSNSHKYTVEYQLLELNNSWPKAIKLECLYVNETEVIRGWRTALRQMNEGDVWELVVPAALAYGDDGVTPTDANKKSIAPGEALRFLIRLKEKA